MSSLIFLVFTGVKNSIKEIIHKPAKLVVYLGVIIAFVAVMVASIFTRSHVGENPAPMVWLQGIFFLLVTLFFVLTIKKGLIAGDTIFDMNDVNFLFTSPVNPRSILLYGIIRLAKISFLASFFLLFQTSSLANFGVGFGGVVLLMVTFLFSLMVQSLLSLVIYSTTNGKAKGKALVKVLGVLIFVPMIAYFIVTMIKVGPIDALAVTISSPWLTGIPIVGWTAAGAISLIQGNVMGALLWLGLLLLSGIAMFIFIMLSKSDYFEDVLVATETAFEKKRALAEGNIHTSTHTSKKTKVKKTGIQGWGASAFFYKHLRETFRENRFGFLSLYSVIMFLGITVASVVFADYVSLIMFLLILVWIQIMMVGTGRGLKELYSHYIYMVPETSFKKLIWSNLELVWKTLLESICFFAVSGIILGESILVIFGAIVMYTLFTLLLVGINYVFVRWTTTNISQGLLLLIYFILVLLVMAPGLAASLLIGLSINGSLGTALGLLILAGWELLAAAGCFALSKSILDRYDMQMINTSRK